MDNILALHTELAQQTYRHGGYYHFKISDPKPRDIHKASVRDRLVHHAIYRILYPYFDKKFIADSYSCRLNKGTHKAINRFRAFAYKVGKNHTRTCWVLKCDIKKFFASINQDILTAVIRYNVSDKNTLWLLEEVISSFSAVMINHNSANGGTVTRHSAKGLPLGNLTSQLFVNIYMNEFDQFMKHDLKVKYYIRYADDFVILSDRLNYLEDLLPLISDFLEQKLKLTLHPNKVSINTFASGVDFLGWVHFTDHRVLRTATRKRILRRLNSVNVQSYLGLIKHGNTEILQGKLSCCQSMSDY